MYTQTLSKMSRNSNICSFLLLFLVYSGSSAQYCPDDKTGQFCTQYDYTVNKTAEQSDPFTKMNAALVIDNNDTTCSRTSYQAQPWWEVNLGYNFMVDGVVITAPSDNLANMGDMTIEVYNGNNKQMCTDLSNPPVVTRNALDCRRRLTGDRVRITLHKDESTMVQLRLCDVGVYGECVDQRYGSFCEHECGDCTNRTQNVCDKTTGRCPRGCDIGFKMPLCKEDCDFGTYGEACNEICGQCKDNRTCEVDTGECLYGCDPGYIPHNCTERCKTGTFGEGCKPCGHCRNNGICEFDTGNCPRRAYCNQQECPNVNCTNKLYCPSSHSCETGWYGDDCIEECPSTKYGDSCLYACGNCFNSSCSNVNGVCEQDCLPGYDPTDIYCKTVCPEGKYGQDCSETCGNCVNNTICLPEAGLCQYGCGVGFKGIVCKDTCDDGFYGPNCQESCGHCSDNKCNLATGLCSGSCSPGWLGNDCRKACDIGKYGQDCTKHCPEHCISRECNNEDGSCTCSRGWTGTLCSDQCNYGPDCPNLCGHCNAGSACDKITGLCINGCAEGWEGDHCTEEVIIERSVDKQFVAGMVVLGVVLVLMAIALVIWIIYRKKTGQSLEPDWMGKARSSIRRSFRRSLTRLSFRNRYQEHTETDGGAPDINGGFEGQQTRSKIHGKCYRRLYECIGISSNTLQKDDFSRVYLQLQEADPEGKTKFEISYQSFLRQRPTYNPINQNGTSINGVNAIYNNAVHTDEIEVDMPGSQPRVPAFLPLGSNLSGFFLINASGQSEAVWNHLQQRQVETLVSIEKEASIAFKAGERYEIGSFTLECLEVHRNPCYTESRVTIRKRGTQGRRAIRHIETQLWENDKTFAAIPTFLLFIQRVQQLYQTKRERPVLINYRNIHDQAVLYCVCASLIELCRETGRIDVLRAVNSGGTVVGKVVNSFEHYKYLHDVMFHTVAMDPQNQKY